MGLVKRPSTASRSIEELEGDYWGDPPADATRLIATAHGLRRRPIGELAVEDLRLLIGQQIGIPILVPIALRILTDNPMAEGHMYEGDLLRAVLRVEEPFWSDHPALAEAGESIAAQLVDPPVPVGVELERWRAARRVR
jgi:hypothetical protein